MRENPKNCDALRITVFGEGEGNVRLNLHIYIYMNIHRIYSSYSIFWGVVRSFTPP